MNTPVPGKLRAELALYQTLNNPSKYHIKPDLIISTLKIICLGIKL